MPQPAQDEAERTPEPSRLLQGQAQLFEVRFQQCSLRFQALRERERVPGDSRAPHRRDDSLDDDSQAGHDQQADADPAKSRHSLGSPSSIPATGAMATTWSSGGMRMTITP